MYSIPEASVWWIVVLIAFVTWSVFWKSVGLWFSAKNNEKIWFLIFLLLSLASVLEFYYLHSRKCWPFRRWRRARPPPTPATVRFESQGVENRGRIPTAIEAVFAAAYAFLAVAFILAPLPSWQWSVSIGWVAAPSLSWVAAVGFGLAVVFRQRVAREWADQDFELVRSIEEAPISLFKILTLISAIYSFLVLVSPQHSLGYLSSLVGFFILLLPIYYATRFYSSKGYARVCLLQFLEKRSESDDWLERATKALVKTLNERGLHARPYDIRAGVNLGLMRGTIDESELRDFANAIPRIGNKDDDKKVIQSLQTLLWEIGTDTKILPMRSMRYRISTDVLTKVLVAFLAAVFANLPAVMKSIETILGLP